MFDIIRNHAAQLERSDAIQDLQAYAEEQRDALLTAAEWLGGKRGARRALEALDSLYTPEVSPRRALHLSGEILALLMLEHVDDPEREEAAIFAEIDPGDARVEDVCLLADGLAARLDACREAGLDDIADGRRAAA